MMLGGGLMMGVGLLFLLLLIGLPILLVIVLLGGSAGFLQKQNRPADVVQRSVYSTSSQAVVASTRYCSHCGAGLHADWTHCPQCGAPIG